MAFPSVLALLLLLSDGTWSWVRGRLSLQVVLLALALAALDLGRVNPEIFVAGSRIPEGTERRDRLLLGVLFPAFGALFLVADLDDGRFHWFPVPWWVGLLGYVWLLAGMGLMSRAQ